MKRYHSLVCLILAGVLLSPTRVLATAAAERQIPIVTTLERVALNPDGDLLGAIVDQNGSPVAGALVVIGQGGRLLAERTTDAAGRFRFRAVQPGIYQVVSQAKAQSYQLFPAERAAPGALKGVIHKMPLDVVRGQQYAECEQRTVRQRVCDALMNPALLVVGVIVGGIVFVALNDDDAS
jgi:hypothetical protein